MHALSLRPFLPHPAASSLDVCPWQCGDGDVCPSVDGISAAVSQQKAGSIPVLAGISNAEAAVVKDAASMLLTSADLR